MIAEATLKAASNSAVKPVLILSTATSNITRSIPPLDLTAESTRH
jgi:hypothetical protein